MAISKRLPLYIAILIVLTILGFSPTYLTHLSDAPLSHHVHAISMFMWLTILMTQAWFVTSGRFPFHRILGRTTFVIAPILVWLMLSIAHENLARRPEGITPEASYVAVLTFYIVPLFVLAYGLAIANRRRPALHIRYMVISGIVIIEAAIFRIFLFFLPGDPDFIVASYAGMTFTAAALLGLALNDLRLGGLKLPFVLFFALVIPKFFLFTYSPEFELWQNLLIWYRELPSLVPWENLSV